jgi:hypothetical protein
MSASRRLERPANLMRRRVQMLSTIALILIVLWLLGMVSSYTMGGFIHILLVVAIVVFLVRIIQGRRPVV